MDWWRGKGEPPGPAAELALKRNLFFLFSFIIFQALIFKHCFRWDQHRVPPVAVALCSDMGAMNDKEQEKKEQLSASRHTQEKKEILRERGREQRESTHPLMTRPRLASEVDTSRGPSTRMRIHVHQGWSRRLMMTSVTYLWCGVHAGGKGGVRGCLCNRAG